MHRRPSPPRTKDAVHADRPPIRRATNKEHRYANHPSPPSPRSRTHHQPLCPPAYLMTTLTHGGYHITQESPPDRCTNPLPSNLPNRILQVLSNIDTPSTMPNKHSASLIAAMARGEMRALHTVRSTEIMGSPATTPVTPTSQPGQGQGARNSTGKAERIDK